MFVVLVPDRDKKVHYFPSKVPAGTHDENIAALFASLYVSVLRNTRQLTVRIVVVEEADVVVVEAKNNRSSSSQKQVKFEIELLVLVVVVSYGTSKGQKLGSLIGIASFEQLLASTSTPASK